MFHTGQQVRVSDREHDGHHRTPAYIKGKVGVVERVHGEFSNPETRAYGDDGLPKQTLYLVGFEQPNRDRILVDVYEHWLEEAE